MDDKHSASTGWNLDEKYVKSSKTTCTYKQTYNINPLMGGFSKLGDTLANSTFNVYQFTGEYKIGASNNNVVLTTTQLCSQASVSFYRALVVFQQKVVPKKAFTGCKQEVIFNENKYTIVVSPFEQYDIDIGTMIIASYGAISYTTFKLPSRTDQSKIAQALFDYLSKSESKIVKPSTNIPRQIDTKASLKELQCIEWDPDPNNPVCLNPMNEQFVTIRPESTNLSAFTIAFGNINTANPDGKYQPILLKLVNKPDAFTFLGWYVAYANTGIELLPNNPYGLLLDTPYYIGYHYQLAGSQEELIWHTSAMIPPLAVGTQTITPQRILYTEAAN